MHTFQTMYINIELDPVEQSEDFVKSYIQQLLVES